jgi:AcrR family transcriptional regulator
VVAESRIKPKNSTYQKRSRLTADAPVEATARVLLKEGYDRASTNRIAHGAGVSIGSLYRYFPSKEALAAAVIDRHMQDAMQRARDALIKVALQPVEAAIRQRVKPGIDIHRIGPKLHRVLTEQASAVWTAFRSMLGSGPVSMRTGTQTRLQDPMAIVEVLLARQG